MKRKLLVFLVILISFTGFSQCNYSFVMTDTGGNGWNGNRMTVKQNGTAVATIGSSFTNGGGPVVVEVPLQDNTPFSLFWETGGLYPTDVRVAIKNSFGQIIYSKPTGTSTQNVTLYSGTVNCSQPACVAPSGFSAGMLTTTSARLTWNNDSSVTQWEVITLPSANPAPVPADSGIITNSNTFLVNGLTCNTSYKSYVRARCSTSVLTSWTASAAFTTLSCSTTTIPACANASSLCGAFGTAFTNTTGVQNQGAMGCLQTTPNIKWFYFSVNTPGQVDLEIKQSTLADMSSSNLDADFVLYGPYSQPVTPCDGQLTPDKVIACSYSISDVEYASFVANQAGKYYYLLVTNYSDDPGYIKISELPTTTASLECSGFRLNVFLDANANGIKDAGEYSFPHGKFQYEKNNDGDVHNVVATSGILNLYEANSSNSYDFSYSIDSDYSAYYNVSSSVYNDVSATSAGITTYNFPITFSNTYEDAAVTLVTMGNPRPGFSYKNKILYTNNGSQVINSGSISFTKDEALTITNVSQSGIVPTSNGFTYDFTNLQPFETRSIEITMQVPTIPTVQLGNLLNNRVSVSIATDAISSNNNFILTEEIIGSYDPNDVMEVHGGEILHSSFTSNDYLYYTIRFENTGTASAIDVRVNTILDTKLDETSLKMINSSHNGVMDRVGSNINWEFKNIMLSPTSQNPDSSKGFVIYKIKPKPGYVIGDIIPSAASIYFDFNPAIVTNTFNTEFIASLSVSQFDNGVFNAYPNPTNGFLTISLKNNAAGIDAVVVSNVLGKTVLRNTFNSADATLDLSNLPKGIYFVKVQTEGLEKVLKVVKQ